MIFSILALLSLPFILFAETWSEGWQKKWESVGYAEECSHVDGNILIQDCQSAAWVSLAEFPITESIVFHGTLYSAVGPNSTTNANMAHHTLFGVDDSPNGQYCGIYLSYDSLNDADDIFVISYPDILWLARYPHRSHAVSVSWDYAYSENGQHYGQCIYTVEGRRLRAIDYAFTVDSLRLWIGANSVAPNMPNDGSSSYAEHGVLYVQDMATD